MLDYPLRLCDLSTYLIICEDETELVDFVFGISDGPGHQGEQGAHHWEGIVISGLPFLVVVVEKVGVKINGCTPNILVGLIAELDGPRAFRGGEGSIDGIEFRLVVSLQSIEHDVSAEKALQAHGQLGVLANTRASNCYELVHFYFGVLVPHFGIDPVLSIVVGRGGRVGEEFHIFVIKLFTFDILVIAH